MVLILAALSEEARLVLDLASHRSRVPAPGCSLWRLSRQGGHYHLLKTGAGPARAAAALARALTAVRPGFLLNIGYAGALAPGLRAGDLVIATRVWEAGAKFTLDAGAAEHLQTVADRAGLPARRGAMRTVGRVLGDAAEKRRLAGVQGVLTVDMETAAFARIAAESGIPFACVRTVVDEAGDTIHGAAWGERLAAARRSLGAFVKAYFEGLESAGGR